MLGPEASPPRTVACAPLQQFAEFERLLPGLSTGFIVTVHGRACARLTRDIAGAIRSP
jgi:hypothetical protein